VYKPNYELRSRGQRLLSVIDLESRRRPNIQQQLLLLLLMLLVFRCHGNSVVVILGS